MGRIRRVRVVKDGVLFRIVEHGGRPLPEDLGRLAHDGFQQRLDRREHKLVDRVGDLFDDRRQANLFNRVLEALDDVVAEREHLPQDGVELLRRHVVHLSRRGARANVFNALHLAREVRTGTAGEVEQEFRERRSRIRRAVARPGLCLQANTRREKLVRANGEQGERNESES